MIPFLRKDTFSFNIFVAFSIFVIFYLLANVYLNQYIYTKSLYYITFGNQLPYVKIDQLINEKDQWMWVGYIIVPLVLFIKMVYSSICLSIGCFLSEYKLDFKNIFSIVIVAEICLAFGMIIRIIWLTFMSINNLSDIKYFGPLSLAQLIGSRVIPNYLLYFCQTINIFEIAYWLVLAAGLVAFLKKPFGKMFKLVMSSYGVGLLLWIVFVSYLTVTFSA